MIKEYPVVIVGGGPAGTNAAKELANAGVKVLLIEKDFNYNKPCGGGLFVKAFKEFNIPTDLISKEIENINITSKTNSATVNISGNSLALVDRKVFDASLRDMAQKAGAELLEAKVYSIIKNSSSYTIKTKNSKETFEIKANYIIAADGVNSTVKKILLNKKPKSVLTHYINISNYPKDSCDFFFDFKISKGYYSWVFPHGNGVNIGLIGNGKNITNNLKELMQYIDIKDKTKLYGYNIPQWSSKEVMYKDRVFYTGDSASLVLPFTYEGIYYALKSGQLAAKAIIKKDVNLYEQEWNNLYKKKFKFLNLLQKIFLINSYTIDKMVNMYKNKKIANTILSYWNGSRKPLSLLKTITKVIKTFLLLKK